MNQSVFVWIRKKLSFCENTEGGSLPWSPELAFDPIGNFPVAGGFSVEYPTQVETGQGSTALLAALVKQVDPSFALGVRPTGRHGGIRKASLENETLDRPGLPSVETCPDGSMVSA